MSTSHEYLPKEDLERLKRKSRSSSNGESSRLRHEEEIKEFAKDETKLAREILSLKKELNRLHYKVKTYHGQTRTSNIVFGSINILLLVIIVYKLTTGG